MHKSFRRACKWAQQPCVAFFLAFLTKKLLFSICRPLTGFVHKQIKKHVQKVKKNQFLLPLYKLPTHIGFAIVKTLRQKYNFLAPFKHDLIIGNFFIQFFIGCFVINLQRDLTRGISYSSKFQFQKFPVSCLIKFHLNITAALWTFANCNWTHDSNKIFLNYF